MVQIVQNDQIDLPKFRFTEPGSNLAFVLNSIAQTFYELKMAMQ